MKHTQLAKLIILVLVLIVVGFASFFLGSKHAVESMTIKRVTPTQIAEAMKGDHFYSDYKENTLLVKGTISTVSQSNGDLVVGFKTSSSYGALCDFGNSGVSFRTGGTITVLAESGPAERQPSAVLLKGCVLL